MRRLLIGLALGGVAAAAGAENSALLYLSCQTTGSPDFTHVYARQPPNREQAIKDVWEAGLVRVFVERPESWVVDFQQGAISSTNDNFRYENVEINAAQMSAVRVFPSGTVETFKLDRVKGSLTLSIVIAAAEARDWKLKHGGDIPSLVSWEQQCSGSTQPPIAH